MKSKPFKQVGFALFVGSCIGSVLANQNYGWNAFAQSAEEAINDISHLLVALTGVVLMTIGLAISKGK